MKKKIALLLVMVLLVTPVLEADAIDLALIIGGLAVFVICMVVWVAIEVAEADVPDDGIRMVSAESEETMPQTSGFERFVNVLQHVEVGPTQDNGFFVGGRFRF